VISLEKMEGKSISKDKRQFEKKRRLTARSRPPAPYLSETTRKQVITTQKMAQDAHKLTDEIIETQQCPCEFAFALHNNPDTGPNTSVDQFCDPRLEAVW
jgi:hypothetical protein